MRTIGKDENDENGGIERADPETANDGDCADKKAGDKKKNFLSETAERCRGVAPA